MFLFHTNSRLICFYFEFSYRILGETFKSIYKMHITLFPFIYWCLSYLFYVIMFTAGQNVFWWLHQLYPLYSYFYIYLYLDHFVEAEWNLNTSKQYKFLRGFFLFLFAIKGSWIWRWSLWYLKTPCLRNATLRISRQATPSSETAPLSPPSSTTLVRKPQVSPSWL